MRYAALLRHSQNFCHFAQARFHSMVSFWGPGFFKWSIPWHHSTNGLPQITTRKRSPNANSSATIGAGSTFTARFKSINHTYRDVIEIEILTDSEMSKVNT